MSSCKGRSGKCRSARLGLIASAVATALAGSGSAVAFEFETDNPDISMRWDNTVRYNLGVRTDRENRSGIGDNVAFDEGEFSFEKGEVVTNRVDLLSEFDFVYQRSYGFRVSGAAWYDHAYKDAEANRNPDIPASVPGSYVGDDFSDYTERFYKGPSAEVLDAFVFGRFYLGETPLTIKAGRHTVFWGETLLLGGALHGVSYSQAPIDLAKGFATPGAEAKELFRPLTALTAQVQATDNLSLAAQYFLDWSSYRYPEGGTYLGPADFAFSGPDQQITALGLLPNAGTRKPRKTGDWGLSARWSPEWLDGTAGFYYRRYTDKLLGLLITSDPSVAAAANPLGLQYEQNYAEDIDMFGVSLAKQIAGVSVSAELSYRRNTPLTTQTLGLTPGAMVGPLAPLSPFLFPRGAGATSFNDNSWQARGNTWHLVLNALGLLPKTALFDTGSYIVELTHSHLDKVTENHDMFFGEGYGVCNPDLLEVPVPAVQAQFRDKWDGCATKNHVGVAINVTPTWFQVFPGVDLSMPISWSKTLAGNSPVVLGGNDDNGNYSIGLSADVYQKYRFDLRYVDFFGRTKSGVDPVTGAPATTAVNGLSTLLKDRGHLVFTFKTTF